MITIRSVEDDWWNLETGTKVRVVGKLVGSAFNDGEIILSLSDGAELHIVTLDQGAAALYRYVDRSRRKPGQPSRVPIIKPSSDVEVVAVRRPFGGINSGLRALAIWEPGGVPIPLTPQRTTVPEPTP